MQSYSPEKRAEYYGWNNAVAAMAHRIAGGFRSYRDLSREDRLELREKAKLLVELGADFGTAQKSEDTVLSGFVYVIDHPKLSGVKVGRAYDPESRLRNYQTGCPRREYRLNYAGYFEDCRLAETAIHFRLSSYMLEGEWFAISPDEAQECIEAFARTLNHQLENNS